jgi:site-specific DNA-methyltransferase (adenine-specific)/modification methylase
MLDDYLNKIIQGDCVELFEKIPDNSIDLIFADPPYNLQLQSELWRPNKTKVEAVNDDWDKFANFEEYDTFSERWLKECKRVLKRDGTIWVIGSYHNIFRIGKIMQDIGFWILNDVAWIKTNPMPNFKGTRFNNAHETLIWAAHNKYSKYTFHYKTMKAFNEDKQMRSDWYIPICNGEERIKVNGKKAHSTQKPTELLYRIIISTSNPGDVILDPFMGSGTTAVVAKQLGRNFIGFEKNNFYIKIANERINNTNIYNNEYLFYPLEQRQAKVPFGNLISSGMLKIGEYLYSKDKKYSAKVLANGTIISNNICGSIHKVSAKLLNKPSNNGWEFWYIEKEGKMVSINEIRKKYQEKFITAKV